MGEAKMSRGRGGAEMGLGDEFPGSGVPKCRRKGKNFC